MLPTGNNAFFRCGRRWPAKAKTKAEIVVIPKRIHDKIEEGSDDNAKAALARAYLDGAVTEDALRCLKDEPILAVLFVSKHQVQLDPVVAHVQEAERSVFEEIADELGESDEPKTKIKASK